MLAVRYSTSYLCSPEGTEDWIPFSLNVIGADGVDTGISEFLLTVGNTSRVLRGEQKLRVLRPWDQQAASGSPLCAGHKRVSRSKRYLRRYIEAESKSPLTVERFERSSDAALRSGAAQGFTLSASNIILSVNRAARRGLRSRRSEVVERALRVSLREPLLAGSLKVRRAGEWRELRAVAPRAGGAPITTFKF